MRSDKTDQLSSEESVCGQLLKAAARRPGPGGSLFLVVEEEGPSSTAVPSLWREVGESPASDPASGYPLSNLRHPLSNLRRSSETMGTPRLLFTPSSTDRFSLVALDLDLRVGVTDSCCCRAQSCRRADRCPLPSLLKRMRLLGVPAVLRGVKGGGGVGDLFRLPLGLSSPPSSLAEGVGGGGDNRLPFSPTSASSPGGSSGSRCNRTTGFLSASGIRCA